ncbi:hypothetical protein DFS34DRAFT_144702 [Phlyctochytrium arcticum]|nr:hypothetical protein DFS34DRAFT_144702 [Phlyctochytrium arcticum]
MSAASDARTSARQAEHKREDDTEDPPEGNERRSKRRRVAATPSSSTTENTSANMSVTPSPLPSSIGALSAAEALLGSFSNEIPHTIPIIDQLPPLPTTNTLLPSITDVSNATLLNGISGVTANHTSSEDRSDTLTKLLQPLSEPPLVPHIRARRAPTSYRRRKPQVYYPAAKPPYLLDRPPPSMGYRVYPGFPAFLQQVTPRNQVTAGEAHRNPVSARFVDRRWWMGAGGGAGNGEANSDEGGDLAADATHEEELTSLEEGHGQRSEQEVEWEARAAAAAAAAAAARVAGVTGFEEGLAAFGAGHQELVYAQQNPHANSPADEQAEPTEHVTEARDLLGMLLMAANGEA